uniref:uncharacterized protein LOC125908320 n=1 Tax=Anopheles coluzzii TaxID=1518534 RepID=UPI0020FFB544|nr:uncharacterized protein LOC125908320 [Anopheles coluzzii]
MNDGYSPDERHCESFYKHTTKRDDSGRYIVRLPKQPDFDAKLGLSRPQAIRRFELLERRLERDPALREAYQDFMKEYLALGHMSPISTDCDDTAAYYLPHHPVFKASSTTTKVRVVFDGSAKTSTGFSLNETLRVGPIVQDELIDIILRFRTYKIAVVADIAKMYRQIVLHPDDRRLVRIFFRFSPQSPIELYELNTVTYGLSPSSFLATLTLLQLAEDEGADFPLASPALRHNFYVDDFIGGANSVSEARELRQQLSELLSKAGFELRKWTSNCLGVLSGLTAEHIGTQSSLQFVPNETVKALGIAWKPELDVLCFESTAIMETANLTMRSILSNIARMFDPLGLIAPVIIRAKLLMQELWLQKIGWDDPVPVHICNKWKSVTDDWKDLESFKSERYVLLPNSKIQFHTFADASEVAYGACIYARCEDQQGRVRVSLLASKSRVAPLKRVTLPRLELCAAVLGAHLHHRVRRAMGIDTTESFFWSDSTVTLNWIASPPNTWKTFVANRVAEIQNYSHPRQWKHIPGSSNPADLVSRGMSAAEMLKGSIWSCGPEWLALSPSKWPMSNPSLTAETDMEIRQAYVSTHRSESRYIKALSHFVHYSFLAAVLITTVDIVND